LLLFFLRQKKKSKNKQNKTMASTLLKWDVEDYFGMQQNSAYFEEENTLTEDKFMQVYSNPSEASFNVLFAGNMPDGYRVIDVTGKTVLQGVVNSSFMELDLSQMQSGVYLLIATFENEVLHTQRLIKTNK
jgi:hypothetical protein